MAKNENNANEGTEIVFRDGNKVMLKPLTIRQLRRFVKLADKFPDNATAELSDDALDAMLEACAIALEKVLPDVDGDYLEDNMDIPLINKVLSIAMGSDDPNQIAA